MCTDTEWERYKYKPKNKPRGLKKILGKLMALRTNKTDRRPKSNSSLEQTNCTNEKMNIFLM